MTSCFMCMRLRLEGALLKFSGRIRGVQGFVKDFTRGSGGMPPRGFYIDSEAISLKPL